MKKKDNVDLEYRINEIYSYGIKMIIINLVFYGIAELFLYIRYEKITAVGYILLVLLAVSIYIVAVNDTRHRKIIKLYNEDKPGLIEFLKKRQELEIPEKAKKIELLISDIEADKFY